MPRPLVIPEVMKLVTLADVRELIDRHLPAHYRDKATWRVVAKELKAAGMDWTDVLAVEDENRRARLAAELLASAAYGSTAARVKAFVEQGGGCRATFFNYRRRLGNGSGNGAG